MRILFALSALLVLAACAGRNDGPILQEVRADASLAPVVTQ